MRHLLLLFLFFIVLMGLPDWYIYRQYVSRWKQAWLRQLYWLPSTLLLIGMIFTFGTYEPRPEAMNRLSLLLIVFLCVNVPKAIFTLSILLFKGLAWKIHHHFHESYIGLAIALFTMAYLIFGATEGKQHFQVKEVTIESKDIPQEFNGYRIVQLADIHAGSWANNTAPMQKAVNIINNLQPDLIVFTGDLVNNLASELDAFIPVFSQLKARQGVYSVLGNHDYSTYIQWDTPQQQEAQLDSLKAKQAQMGWTLLNNRHVKLYQQNDSIALIGVENSGRPPFPDHAQLNEAMQGTEGMFQILLSHDPSHWRREVLPHTDIQLTLSGHTHAMQTKLFGFTPAQFVYPENDGLYQEGDQMLYVNIGLGHLLYPIRLGAWPEITLLTLKAL
ncbi:MAG: metallophosphoesterase [Bacteroidaceae bacterium]|nr:metallophosphoesterase [Bacteroidaceae bacterium]